MSIAPIAVETGIPMLDRVARSLNEHDLDALARTLTDDAEIRAPGAEQLRGGNDWAAFHSPLFTAFSDAQVEVHTFGQIGNAVVHEGTFHGTHTGPMVVSDSRIIEATGKVIAHGYMEIFWINDEGSIDKVHLYHDPATLYDHLAAVE